MAKVVSRKKKILVIEDDAEMRSLLKDFIEEEDGYKAESVEDGSEAFRKLAKEHFDLILTDIRMPGLSGLEILPGLKKLQPKSSIVVITAFGSEEIYRRASERGADAYLEKPIHWDELRNLIKKMVSCQKKESKGNPSLEGGDEILCCMK